MAYTAQDALDWFKDEIRTTKDYDRHLTGDLKKHARISNMTPSQMPCDPEFIERRFPENPGIAVSRHWSSLRAYRASRRSAQRAMKLFLRRNDPPEVLGVDGWTQVIERVQARHGTIAAIPVKSLARECRRHGFMPGAMDGESLVFVLRNCAKSTTAKSVQNGWRRLEAMKDDFDCPVPSDFAYDAYRRRNVAWRLPMPADLQSRVDVWVEQKVNGEFIGFEGLSERGVSDTTAFGIRDSIAYFYTAGVTLHPALGGRPGFDVVSDVDVLIGVVAAEKRGAMPWKPMAPTTVLSRLRFIRAFLEGNGLGFEQLRRLERLIDLDHFAGAKKMSPSRSAWCHRLMQQPQMKETYLQLPGILWGAAKSELAFYEEAVFHNRTRILNWGVAACLGAVWGSLPLRIKNTEFLTVGEEDSDVQVSTSAVVISTRAIEVKNDYEHIGIPLAAKSGVDPASIVRWYCQEIRPRLLADDKYCQRPDLLFCGMGKFRLRRIWKRSTLAQNIPMTPHYNRHAQATLLLNDAGLPMNVIAAHLGTSEEVAERNYAFVVESLRHKAAQAALASLSSEKR